MKVVQIVNDKIINQLQKGVVPWRKPFGPRGAYSVSTGKSYSILNQMLLGLLAHMLRMTSGLNLAGMSGKGKKGILPSFGKCRK